MSLTRSIGYGGGVSAQSGPATYVSSARTSSTMRVTRPISGNSAVTRPFAFAAQSLPNSRFSTPGYRSGSPTYQRASPAGFAQSREALGTEAAASDAQLLAPASIRAPVAPASMRVTVGSLGASASASRPALSAARAPFAVSLGASASRPALSATRARAPRHSAPAASQSVRAPTGSSIAWDAAVPAVATARSATMMESTVVRPAMKQGEVLVMEQNISREELIASGRLFTKGSAPMPVIDHSRFLVPSVATIAPQQVVLTEQEQMALNEYMTPHEVAGTLYQSDMANGYSDIVLQQDDLIGQSDMDADFRESRSVDPVAPMPAAFQPKAETVQPLPDPYSLIRATTTTPIAQYEADVGASTMVPDIEAPTPPVPVSQDAALVPDSQVVDEANGRRRATAEFVPNGRGAWGPADGAEQSVIDEANARRRDTAEFVPDGIGGWGRAIGAEQPVTVAPDVVAAPVTTEAAPAPRLSGSRLSRAGFNV